MAVLNVPEYGRIYCGESFDSVSKTITKSQRSKLERFAEDYKRQHKAEIFRYGPRQTLVAQNFVGVINVGKDQIEILPKIDGLEVNSSQVRRNLAAMLAVSMGLTLRDGDASSMDRSRGTVLEILIRLFCKQVWVEVHKGLLRTYTSHSDSLSLLRGRLNLRRQLRDNLAHPERLACDFDEFSENNRLNQTVKAALRLLGTVTRSAENRRSLSELLFCFEDVDDVHPNTYLSQQDKTSRTSARYSPILNLSRLFLCNQSPDVISGKGDGFALLFDMNELFEAYIGRVTYKICLSTASSVRLQGPVRYLAQRTAGTQAFALRPDIVISTGGRVVCVIDTKWKRLDSAKHRDGVSSADMYQMHAYARRYEADHILLVYPHHGGLVYREGRGDSYEFESTTAQLAKQTVTVATINLQDLATVPAQLKQLMPELTL